MVMPEYECVNYNDCANDTHRKRVAIRHVHLNQNGIHVSPDSSSACVKSVWVRDCVCGGGGESILARFIFHNQFRNRWDLIIPSSGGAYS